MENLKFIQQLDDRWSQNKRVLLITWLKQRTGTFHLMEIYYYFSFYLVRGFHPGVQVHPRGTANFHQIKIDNKNAIKTYEGHSGFN